MKSTRLRTSQGFSNLIGIPYEKKDCWAIARDFYSQVLGIELKHYYEDSGQRPEHAENLIYTAMGDFAKVDKPQYGDLILIRIAGVECHIAIYLGVGKMLHSSKYKGSVIESMGRWMPVIVGYYRPKDLIND